MATHKYGDIPATPTKEILTTPASNLDTNGAISELVDNAIDNFAKQESLGRPNSPVLKVEIRASSTEVSLIENSGGVSPSDLVAFVKPGSHGTSTGSPSIGVWGQGQKIALCALGTDVTIQTAYWNSIEQYSVENHDTSDLRLHIAPRWWTDNDNWSIPAYAADGSAVSGETHFLIKKLRRPFDESSVIPYLAKLYGAHVASGELVLTVNDQAVPATTYLSESDMRERFAFPPGFPPTKHQYVFERDVTELDEGVYRTRTKKLTVHILVGLTPHGSTREAGVYMFGVPEGDQGWRGSPRLFAEHIADESVGYGDRAPSILRKNDPTLARLRIYVTFYGAGDIIPWGTRGSAVKWGYDAENLFAPDVKDAIREAARPYARFTKKADEADLVPFSSEWSGLPLDGRRKILARGAKVDPIEFADPVIKKRASALLKGGQPISAILVWDHEAAPTPPTDIPAFSDPLSKEAIRLVTQRDALLKQLKTQSDPVGAVAEFVDVHNKLRKLSGQKPSKGSAQSTAGSRDPLVAVANVQLRLSQLRELTTLTGTTDRRKQIRIAVDSYIAKG